MRHPLYRRSALLVICLALIAVGLLAACGSDKEEEAAVQVSTIPGMTFDAAVDKLVADGYPQGQNEFLNSLGSSPLGFRIAGSEAARQAAQHVADEMAAMGLSNVRLEEVPVDAWDFKSASVTVGDRQMAASSFAGSPGTSGEAIAGDLVYVGPGGKADYKKAGDVQGKIVLIDTFFEEIWINLQCAEATLQGAKAVVSTYGPTSAPWYKEGADTLGGNDAEYDQSFVPVVYVARSDGDWLKKRLEAGEVEATVESDITLTLAENGGKAYNVVGELAGSSGDGSMVVIGGHTDAHFRAGGDDTGAVSATLTMARAMKMSGYTPKRTIIFFFDTAEEYGYTDCYFDWIIGAWYAITHEHTDWPGKAVAYINLETMAEKDGILGVDAPAEFTPWLKTLSSKAATGFDRAPRVSGQVSSWSNGWTFTAAGVPTITLAATRDDYWNRYHTTVEVDANLDWQFLGQIVKYTGKLQAGLDEGAPPYALGVRGKEIVAGIDAAGLKEAGADAGRVKRLAEAAAAYQKAAAAADARIAALPAEQQTAVAGDVMAVERDLNRGTLALSVWEEQILPHEQVAYDAAMLRATMAALQAGNAKAALAALVEVSATWNAMFVSNAAYVQDIARWAPDYPKLTWGAQSHLPPMLNVWPQYELIQKGKLSQAASQLQPVYESETAELDKRLDETAALLEELTPRVEALQ